jgi:regulator of cell morphogenesis and NO signaling
MELNEITIDGNSIVSDIVKSNFHTADVFRRHDIEYCCGGRWPLEAVCHAKGIELDKLKKELTAASRVVYVSAGLPYHTWPVDFLTDYIVNVHHSYIRHSMPVTGDMLRHFAGKHEKKYPYLMEVRALYEKLEQDVLPHLAYEEEIIFPYICQVAHAYENNDSYARLLVKTLRKPLDALMQHEHTLLEAPMVTIRELTKNFAAPENACISHRVVLARLEELDNDLVQHLYLENQILFPTALRIEKEILQ